MNTTLSLPKVPVVGEKYHFFDDGKMTCNRHYIAECLEVITPEDAKDVLLEVIDDNLLSNSLQRVSLYDIWKDNVTDGGWLFNEETDYFVRCRVEGYDEHDLWFVRSCDYRWWSLEIQSCWQVGLLDVDNKLHNKGIKLFGKDYYIRQL